jgi:hypothetical protein
MKTYPILKGDSLVAFEIGNNFITVFEIKQLLKRSQAISNIKSKKLFRNTETRLEFSCNQVDYILTEPYGDNSRYWIGPVVNGINSELIEIGEIFKGYRPFALRKKNFSIILILIFSIFLVSRNDNYIWLQNQDSFNDSVIISESKKLFIHSHVIEFEENSNFAVALRQNSKTYECGEGIIAVELTKKIDYWISDKSKLNLEGPLSYQQFKQRLLALNIFDQFKITPAEFILKKYKADAAQLQGCLNPKEII